MVTLLYLIRHCEAIGNIQEIFQGSIDGDITEKGQMQLDRLAVRCKEIPFDVIYSSPLKRAVKTAQAANKYHKLEIHTDPAFSEIDGGELEGHKWKELPQLFPSTYYNWEHDFASFRAVDGESMKQVYARMSQGAMKAVQENIGKNILIVSHGCALRNLCCFLQGKPIEEIASVQWADNTGITCYSFDRELKPAEIFFNDCSHITNDDSTAPHQMWWRNNNTKK